MEANDDHGRTVAARTKFTTTEAARVALTLPRPRPTPARARLLDAATRLWCRGGQFPTARGIAAEAGLRSVSTVVAGFGSMIELHGTVIRIEWDAIAAGWLAASPPDRNRWLLLHGRALLTADPACLRLPGLVCSAVVGAGLLGVRLAPERLAPLHALGALPADPGRTVSDTDLERLVHRLGAVDRQPFGLVVSA